MRTPGPWTVIISERNGHEIILIKSISPLLADDVFICEVEGLASDAEALANAKAIAAVPEIVEALKLIETICIESLSDCRKRMGTRVGNTLVAARAALAKAGVQ